MALDYSALYPVLIMVAFAAALPAVHLVAKSSRAVAGVSVVGILASMGLVLYYMMNGYPVPMGGPNTPLLQFDVFAALFALVFQSVALITVLTSARYIEKDRHQAEYFALIMLATAGMMLTAMAVDLITLYVGLEVASISTFALVAFRKKDKRGAEASVKYLVIGGLSSALSLYGISLLYGITGTTNLAGVNAALAAMPSGLDPAAWMAIALLVAGFGFKVAIVPFHMWAPDVYEGAPTPISGLLAAGSKKMGMVLMFKVFIVALIALKADWQVLAGVLAILTMTIGNVVALQQTNIKRMLAYSSIGQAGYMIIAIAVATQFAVEGGIFHIITHAFMKGGAFMIVAALSYVALGENISDYKGLARRAPLIALSMAIFLFALAGIPPLSGFWSKVILFSSAIDAAQVAGQQWMMWLAVAGILNSALSLYYYVRVIKYMFVDEGVSTEKLKIPMSMSVAIAICVIATIAIGLWPNPVIDICSQAARTLFPI
ncbi:MAG: NADH-quinone oxidoreductase subunit N [Methanomassiliicoccus sp.]|nr:NADH-quinone oxidoreductase subunit N [Methanomassiliicoccus sp.]